MKDIFNKCEIIFKTLQEVDNTVIITIYKGVENREAIMK